jgi:hypothetical protein
MKKDILFILVVAQIFAFYHSVLGQERFVLRAKNGWATYSMSQFKKYQDLVIENLLVDAKITDQYPSYFYQQFQILAENKQGYLRGLVLDFASTGGRIAYSDYSGSYRYDQKLKKVGIGAHLEEQLFKNKHFQVSSAIQLTLHSTKLAIDEYLDLEGDVSRSSPELATLGGAIDVLLGGEYRPFDFLLLRADIGYQAQVFSESFQLDNTPRLLKEELEETHFKPNWSGFRGGIALGFLF